MRFRDQTGLDGIQIDVALRGREVLFVSDEAIPIVGLPEFARTSEYDVSLSCGEALPRADDCPKWHARQNAEQDMDMVRHDSPGVQSIALAVEDHEKACSTSWATRPFLSQHAPQPR